MKKEVMFIIIMLVIVSLSGCTDNSELSSDNDSFDNDINTEEEETESNEEQENTSNVENNPPDTPNAPYGPTIGNVNVEYTFSQSTKDLDGDLVKYRFDWGDGTYSDWSDLREHELSYSQGHSWSSHGTYQIRIQARDENGGTSEWSSPLQLEIRDTGTIEIIYPSISSYMCFPQGSSQIGLKPTIRAYVNWWIAPSDYEIPNMFLTWYVKQNGFWVDVKNIQVATGGNYYYYFEEADEYSTTYYWKVQLFDEQGTIYDEKSFSFPTIPNAMPLVSVVSLCNWWDCELQPTVSVEISDQYGDRMDLTWYILQDDSWIVTHIDQNLGNGTYHYTYENVNEYGTRYDWKVRVTDEYGEYMERECSFWTKTPTITISDVLPPDESTFFTYINNEGTSSVASPLTFSATISNSEGHIMDIEFVHKTHYGTFTNIIQNVNNGTYSWTPTEKQLYAMDTTIYYVKIFDINWGRYKTSSIHHFTVKRAWVQFEKDEVNNSLTVTCAEPSYFTWDEIELIGTGTLPTGVITVGDKITDCSGTVSLYWSAVDFLIGTWTFT